MRIARLMLAVLLVMGLAPRVLAQVSCADPNNLCTGDPCTITNTSVQSPCIVDFGNRTLVIAGILDVPDAGTLSFTAATIIVQGPIDGRHVGNGSGSGAAITLISTTGDIELRGEIDVSGTVASGTIDVQAGANLLVKDRLNAKTAGSNITASGGDVSLDAQGTILTDQTAVIDVAGLDETTSGGSVSIDGDAGVTVKGRVRAVGNPSGTVSVSSANGSVVLDKDIRVEGETVDGGTVTVNAGTGVRVNQVIRADSEDANGGTVTLNAASGDVVINDAPNVRGVSSGSLSISAPLGTVAPNVILNARGTSMNGGSIAIAAATVDLRRNLDVRGRLGVGGTIDLDATTLLNLSGGDMRAEGIDGGTVDLRGGAASGDVTILKTSTIRATGTGGGGGSVMVSAPAGAVSMKGLVDVVGRDFSGGQVQVDGAFVTIGPGARFDADGDFSFSGGVLQFTQSGTGLMLLDGTFDARRNGTIEASAPSGDLTARGRFRVAPAGCVGLSAGGTLDTSGATTDVPITASCP